ncbi:MAG: class I SAM-dependent methyltransferase [Myxococcota bacterium]
MSREDRERWDARYARGSHYGVAPPAAFLEELEPYLPTGGRVLDLAGGAGRNGVWFAERGFEVTVADVSPVGLQIAHERARAAGVFIETLVLDLEREALPRGPWEVAFCLLYFEPRVFAQVEAVLAPGGLFAFSQPTTTNLERHPRPPARFLVAPGQVPALVPPGLETLVYREAWEPSTGQHEARLIARRRSP